MYTLTAIVAQATGSELSKDWWDSSVGGAIKAVLVLVGVLVVLKGIMTFVKELSGGKTGPAVRSLVASLILAAFAFRPELISSVIDLFSGIVQTVLGSAEEVVVEPYQVDIVNN